MSDDIKESLASVPVFGRIGDMLGLWYLEPLCASQLWSFASNVELLRLHMAEPNEEPTCAVEMYQTSAGKIADIRLQGLLTKGQSSMGGTSTIQARREIRKAATDPETAGIMLSFDSPGGTVSGTAELASDVRAAAKQKPVWSFAEDMMASAAYYVGSQANKVFANTKDAKLGSIGTIQVVRDYSEAFAKEGVKTLVFSTGPLKGAGAQGTPITQEHSDYFQSMIDGAQQGFDEAVKSGRSMSQKELETVRHGGLIRAQDAVGQKLIDGIASKDKVMSDFARYLKSPRQISQNAEMGPAKGGFPVLKRFGLPTIKG